MAKLISVVVLICIQLALDASAKKMAPVVDTPLGPVRGTVDVSRTGRPIFLFRGIRYAEAPVNELRFEPPVPVKKWRGVYDATKDGPLCPQETKPTKNPVTISEDCLILNVYTPKLHNNKKSPKLPVIVFIHDGGYLRGGSASYMYGPEYLLDHDVVLVTLNYRLGTLGFFNTGEKEAPGNNGLRDQILALKWIKDNIEPFGGDSGSVTITGSSVGGWSVAYLIVSPLAQGLFHKAVVTSGSPTGVMTLVPNQMDVAKQQAQFVGCPDDTTAKMISCLRGKPYQEIIDSYKEFKGLTGQESSFIWWPSIESDFGQERVVPAHPIEIITSGVFNKVPLMTGQTKDEYGYLAYNVVYNETLRNLLNEDFEKYAPDVFTYDKDTELSRNISRAIKSFYLKDKDIDESQLDNVIAIFADVMVGFAVNRFTKLVAAASDKPVYYFEFTYQGAFSNFYTPTSNFTKPFGIVHHDDLIYLFKQNKFPISEKNQPKDVELIEKFTSIYANFAKTGNPIPTKSEKMDNVEWVPFTIQNNKYLEIGNELVMKENLFKERFSVWESVVPLRPTKQ
ncbi:unnamed protein product [Phyllotreta striolata]|uniref:Carboxylesterase type B domain-containing protein n=1 Tax=Phyllotreta striolata TaxID=444603 RepID=A0A9P0DGK7_PHYSR|nr:unnamed protein product [Phyllotreta striolata]